MQGKRGLIMGLANDRSLAWGIARALGSQGAEHAKLQVDRVTVLPARARTPLAEQVRRVEAIHADDRAQGFGRVHLPHALARKDPEADRSLA